MRSGENPEPTGLKDREQSSKAPTARKVSLEHGYKRNRGDLQPYLANSSFQPSLANMSMCPTHMNDMMMMNYEMMALGPDPYGMNPHFMPMHPADAAAMGPMVDQMMDFPPPRFLTSKQGRFSNRPIQSTMLPDMRNSMDDFRSEISQSSRSSPYHSTPNTTRDGLRGASTPPTLSPPMTVKAGMRVKRVPPMVACSAAMFDGGCRRERAPPSTSFPIKLFKILADPQFEEIIAWLPHGRAWRILKSKSLEEEVIPRFFRSDRYASFMRQVGRSKLTVDVASFPMDSHVAPEHLQVNGWGFKRITEGPDLNAYYHEMFLRGLPQVCAKMRRPQKSAATGNRDAGPQPDFYKISKFAPLPVECDGQLGPRGVVSCASQVMMNDAADIEDERGNGENIASKPIEQNQDGQENCSIDKKQDGKKKSEVSGSSTEMVDASKTESFPPGSPLRLHITECSVADSLEVRTPVAFSDGQDIMNLLSSRSVKSWNEQDDGDSIWGGLSGSNSPRSPSYDQGSFNEGVRGLASNCFGQVTPTGRICFVSSRGGFGRQRSPLRSPYAVPDTFPGEESDASCLSEADLRYLTEQNHYLLSEAQRRASFPG